MCLITLDLFLFESFSLMNKRLLKIMQKKNGYALIDYWIHVHEQRF